MVEITICIHKDDVVRFEKAVNMVKNHLDEMLIRSYRKCHDKDYLLVDINIKKRDSDLVFYLGMYYEQAGNLPF